MASAAASPPQQQFPASPPPYSVHLSPETARNFATNGATILLLDVPLGTPIGLDQQVFLSGPSFKGIKMLPPGVHFLSYQALSKDGRNLSPPVGTFLWLKPRQVYVRRWDHAGECLVALADVEEESRYAAGVARFDFDRQLAPYDLGRYSQWFSLSSHITEQVLSALLPEEGAHAPAALLAQARVLERVLAVGLGWDFRLHQLQAGSDDDESDVDDDGPVRVELTEQQLAELEANSNDRRHTLLIVARNILAVPAA
eukprot:gene11434-11580_t